MTELLVQLERSLLARDYAKCEEVLREVQNGEFSATEVIKSRQLWKRVKAVVHRCRMRDSALRSLYFGAEGRNG